MATFRTFSDFQSQTRTWEHVRKTFLKNGHKKIAAPAPELFDPGWRASLFMCGGPGVYVQHVTQGR